MDLNQHESAMLLHLIDQWPRPACLWEAIKGNAGVANSHSGETLFSLQDKRLIRVYRLVYLRLTQQGTTQACQLLSQIQTLN
jgi:hypothetical protein